MADKKIQLHTQDGTDNLYPVTKAANVTGLATVATSGSYNDLSNKPSIPTIPGVATTTTNGLMSSTDKSQFMKEAYLTWGGKDFSGSYGPIDAALINNLSANRFAGVSGGAVTVEYSTDSGSTWTVYPNDTNQKKTQLFTTGESSYNINPTVAKDASGNYPHLASNMMRITVDCIDGGIYTYINKVAMYVSTSGSAGSSVTILGARRDTPTNFDITIKSKTGISGWSGWNVINGLNVPNPLGNSSQNYIRKIRFVFTQNDTTASQYQGLNIQWIQCYGGVGWNTPSPLAGLRTPYKLTVNGNGRICVTFLDTMASGDTKHIALGQGTGSKNCGYIYYYYAGSGSDNNRFSFYVNGQNNIHAFGDGSVGINTATRNASYKLNVNGNANATSLYENGTALSATYAAKSHSHAQSDITGLSTSLAAKLDKSEADDTYAAIDHNHDSKYIGFTDKTVTVAGTSKVVSKTSKDTLFAKGGMIFGGTAAAAGLVTRGICGVVTPADADGSCTKDNLFINYDGNNNFNSSRQLVLNAGAVGTHLGNNMYQYTAPRGDIVKAYCDAHYLASVPTASSTVLGGIKIASPFTISNGVLGINSFSGTSAGLVPAYTGDEDDSAVLKQTGWGHLTAGQVGAAAASHNHSASNITSGTLAVARGGTGKTTGADAANYFLNELSVGTSTPKDADYFISQYANGGTTTTTYHRRSVSALWDLYKTKCITGVHANTAASSSVYTGKPIMFVPGNNMSVTVSNTTSYVRVLLDSYGSCLIEGTKIKMIDGSEKNIEDIEPGESIMSYDPNTRTNVEAVVVSNSCTGTADDYTNYYFDDGNFVTIYGKHCLYNADEGTARGVDFWEIGWTGMNDKNEEITFIGSEDISHAGRKKHYDIRSSNKLYYANGILTAQALTLDYSTLPDRDPELPQVFLDAIKADYDSSANITKHKMNKNYGKRLVPILREMKAQQKKMDDNKKRLADTDYIVSKFTEGLISASEWAKSKGERSNWRKLVNEAEDALVAVKTQFEALKEEYKPQSTKRERFNAAVARDNACLDALKEYYKEKNSK